MTDRDIENLILKWAYDQWLRHSGGIVFSLLEERPDIDQRHFQRTAEKLEIEGYIDGVGWGTSCEITPQGILETENRNLFPFEHLEKVGRIRYELLDAAYEAFEKDGRNGDADVNDVIDLIPGGRDLVHVNYSFLSDLGFIETRTIRLYAITEPGKRQIREWQHLVELNREFERVSKMKPQERGKAFETLVTKLFESQGWNVDKGLRTSNEEFDLIMSRDREFFLVECKWTKKPVAPKDFNHHLAKPNKRAGTKGMIISMKGFTAGAIKDIEEATSQRVIILFGENDITELLKNPDLLESVIDKKYSSLVTKRIALWA